MTKVIEVTQAEMLAHMRDNVAMYREVAESISMNREGFAHVAIQIAKKPLTQDMALGLCKIMHDVLMRFADDVDEAVKAAETGEMVAKVVAVHPLDESDTKH